MAVNGEAVAQAVEAVLQGTERRVEKYLYPFLYLEPGGHRGRGRTRAAAGGGRGPGLPAVAGYYTADGACSGTTSGGGVSRTVFTPNVRAM